MHLRFKGGGEDQQDKVLDKAGIQHTSRLSLSSSVPVAARLHRLRRVETAEMMRPSIICSMCPALSC